MSVTSVVKVYSLWTHTPKSVCWLSCLTFLTQEKVGYVQNFKNPNHAERGK